MAKQHDVVIIGAGHNGLIAAFYLAKAGLKPLVLERRPQTGGAAISDELCPGFRSSILTHSAGPLRRDIVEDMQLEKYGLELIRPDPGMVALGPDGRALPLYKDPGAAAREIAHFSQRDQAKYLEFHEALAKLSRLIADVLAMTPPDIDDPSAADLWAVIERAYALRGLGKKDMYRLLRWLPMAVADLVGEFFETELLRATIAARGIFGTCFGPWSAGSGLMLLIRAAADAHPAGSACFARGGMGSITKAMASAAQQAGAKISTGVEVAEICIQDGAATAVRLAQGEEIPAQLIVSNADPKRTLLKLVDPTHLSPDFVQKIKNYRSVGTVAKINFALDAVPEFTALKGAPTVCLMGRMHIGPHLDYLEKAFDEAKYGNFSRQPYLELAIPSLTDPSLVPKGKHVMSVYMQYAPYKLSNGDWTSQKEALGDAVVNTLAEYAPGFRELVRHRQIITPQDLEDTYGLTGGHVFHGELSLDQFFTMRPLLDWARYRTPISNLYLCGSGTHPGAGLTGGSGANAAREILKQRKKWSRYSPAQSRSER